MHARNYGALRKKGGFETGFVQVELIDYKARLT